MTEPNLNPSNLAFVEDIYLDYLKNPESVDPIWRDYFKDMPKNGLAHRASLGPSFTASSLFNPPSAPAPSAAAAPTPTDLGTDAATLQRSVEMLIRNYRVRGHIMANLDPLGRPVMQPPELEPSFHGISEADLDREVPTTSLPGVGTVRDTIDLLKNTYCRSIGVQFMHIDDLEVRRWLQERMEGSQNRLSLSRDMQLRILTRLTDAVIFEEFIQRKYVGAKSFSLEGGESLIPLLDLAIEKAGEHGLDEIVMAMAHRGRLNVLANIMGKDPRDIFREFDDVDPELSIGRGDVKYHLGYSNDWQTASGKKVHLSLCFNPSHLEFVNTVALGRVRAKQDRSGDFDRERGMALIIHGDAAFAGEGVVQETLNLSELMAYKTGGTLHVVINNQIGFTTAPNESRSTPYATDVAKMLQSPLFHVNGEDPEAVAQTVQLAMDFRREFQRDVVIDMYCYRRYGHNEGDEPSFTQPQLYEVIRQRKGVREGYLERLLTMNGVTQAEGDKIAETRREELETELSVARQEDFKLSYPAFGGVWSRYVGGDDEDTPRVETGVHIERLADLLEAQTRLPKGFNLHPKLKRMMQGRLEMARGERPLDWSTAEALAFATLATEGYPVRLTGQDTERGTFSQRHSVLHDTQTGAAYVPLQHLSLEQARVEIYNSALSEIGVLGFEYGYSLDYPDAFVAWEAQFGDFVNAAQVIIDQYIASAEDKWRRLSGLVMLLPHGFEGQGPEHSSARLERFLMLCAEDNMQILNLTTPAQYFHALRRQVVRPWRKPLVIMTPKSLLRHAGAVSSLDELAGGRFERIIPDNSVAPEEASRVILCSGKVYYELEAQRQEQGHADVAILRLEQLYPLDMAELKETLAPYRDGTPVVWVQEEPENMGAWRYLRVTFGERLFKRLPFYGVSRPASASPATGSKSAHGLEQAKVLQGAFGELEQDNA